MGSKCLNWVENIRNYYPMFIEVFELHPLINNPDEFLAIIEGA